MAESQPIKQAGESSLADRDWLLKKLNEHPGDFLRNFITACLYADAGNWEIVAPALEQIRQKYPLQKPFLNETAHGQ
jgi:hypothetical protein